MIGYRQFTTDSISFVLHALAVFILVKKVPASMKKAEVGEQKPVGLPQLSREEELLTEIRDLLAKQP